MARFGVNILKRASYRAGTQHFGNTYYYETPGVAQPSLTTLEALVDDIVAKEKVRFATSVTFVRGRLWSQVGTPAQNQMLVDKLLSGAGAATADAQLDRERAWLVRFRAGVDTKGRPVYLRKYFHLMCDIQGGSVNSADYAQTAQLTQAKRDAVAAFGNLFKQITVGTPAIVFDLVAKNGRPIDGATQGHPFLEHRQLGEEWRGL